MGWTMLVLCQRDHIRNHYGCILSGTLTFIGRLGSGRRPVACMFSNFFVERNASRGGPGRGTQRRRESCRHPRQRRAEAEACRRRRDATFRSDVPVMGRSHDVTCRLARSLPDSLPRGLSAGPALLPLRVAVACGPPGLHSSTRRRRPRVHIHTAPNGSSSPGSPATDLRPHPSYQDCPRWPPMSAVRPWPLVRVLLPVRRTHAVFSQRALHHSAHH